MILFTDIAGITNMSQEVDPAKVMHFLNCLYSRYDQLLDAYNVYKVLYSWQSPPKQLSCHHHHHHPSIIIFFTTLLIPVFIPFS